VSWKPTGSSATLATYAYQGSATSKKTIAYSSTVNGVTDFAFDQYGRHSKIETLNGSTVLGKVEFFYDAASNLTKEKYAHFAASGVVREGDRFFYDEHHRLADAWLGADTATFNTEPPPATPTLIKRVTYGLDAANNRTQVATVEGSSGSTETYATDDDSTPSNRYTTVGLQTYLYDARGNLTRQTDPNGKTTAVSYNALNKPTSITNALGQTVTVASSARFHFNSNFKKVSNGL
jgi:YD repeat-containing protein